MNTYLISYDLGGPETSESYKGLIKEIENYGCWANPLESLWFIRTEDSIDLVMNKLELHLDNNDKIIVMNVTHDMWYTLNVNNRIVNWMQNNI